MLIYHTFKKTSACLKVFVECIVCFSEFEEVASSSSSSFESAAVTFEASRNIKNLKRAFMKSLWHFDSSGSRNSRSFGGINLIVYKI